TLDGGGIRRGAEPAVLPREYPDAVRGCEGAGGGHRPRPARGPRERRAGKPPRHARGLIGPPGSNEGPRGVARGANRRTLIAVGTNRCPDARLRRCVPNGHGTQAGEICPSPTRPHSRAPAHANNRSPASSRGTSSTFANGSLPKGSCGAGTGITH